MSQYTKTQLKRLHNKLEEEQVLITPNDDVVSRTQLHITQVSASTKLGCPMPKPCHKVGGGV